MRTTGASALPMARGSSASLRALSGIFASSGLLSPEGDGDAVDGAAGAAGAPAPPPASDTAPRVRGPARTIPAAANAGLLLAALVLLGPVLLRDKHGRR